MKVEDILGKRCFLYVKDIIDIYNMQQEREKAVLTKVFGHLYLNGNKFVFYFNWIKELDHKEMLYSYRKGLKIFLIAMILLQNFLNGKFVLV